MPVSSVQAQSSYPAHPVSDASLKEFTVPKKSDSTPASKCIMLVSVSLKNVRAIKNNYDKIELKYRTLPAGKSPAFLVPGPEERPLDKTEYRVDFNPDGTMKIAPTGGKPGHVLTTTTRGERLFDGRPLSTVTVEDSQGLVDIFTAALQHVAPPPPPNCK
jgi:hypothetical protein